MLIGNGASGFGTMSDGASYVMVAGVIERAGIAKAERPFQPRFELDALAVGQRRCRPVRRELHGARARLAVDALDRQQQPRALGRPRQRLLEHARLHARHARQLEPADVVGGRRWAEAAQRADGGDGRQEHPGGRQRARERDQRSADGRGQGPRRPGHQRRRQRRRCDAAGEGQGQRQQGPTAPRHGGNGTGARRRVTAAGAR